MRIKSIQLKNFKRFSDLLITDIPESAKLVLIVGPNGCGKSSLFDALLHWHAMRAGVGWSQDEYYYRKDKEISFGWSEAVDVTLDENSKPEKGSLYARTAYRNDPDFTIQNIGRLAAPSDSNRFNRLIQNDQTVGENYQRLVYETMAAVYEASNNSKTVGDLREELIGAIRVSMANVFGDLTLNNISDPLGAGTFLFGKGNSASYQYKNLSGGEKSAFDLLLDLHIKKRFYVDAIYCIDEIETHLHTRVQSALTKEMVKIMPDKCQLWLTTHSLGVMRAAQELEATSPGSVCVISFDDVNPDLPQEIRPSNLGQIAWQKLLSIAMDDLSERMSPKFIIICEGSSLGKRRKDFDAQIYNSIFKESNSEIVFVSGGSSDQLAVTGSSVQGALKSVSPKSIVATLCDRDDKSNAEINEILGKGNLVLPYRNLESYLFEDEILSLLVNKVGQDEKLQDVLNLKKDALTDSINRGNSGDDLKSAAGSIYIGIKRILSLIRCGNDTDSFMRDTLAPLVTSNTVVYGKLQVAIFDQISKSLLSENARVRLTTLSTAKKIAVNEL